MSMFQQIRPCRITAAERMLIEISQSVEQISRRCGFSSGMRSRRVFRQDTGLSPSEFRSSNQVCVRAAISSKNRAGPSARE
ncbi:MAG: helix-turn-helix domain-containing protein [Planctomycetota bacterium]